MRVWKGDGMNKICYGLMAVLVLLIIVAFFMPWVSVESTPVVSELSRIFTKKEVKISQSISAYHVPMLANTEDARLANSVIKILNPDTQDAGKNSFLIWLVPLLAVAILLLSILFSKNKWVHLASAAVGILIFVIGVYRIKTLNLNQIILNVAIGPGLWLTLWAYLGIGVCALLNFVKFVTGSKE